MALVPAPSRLLVLVDAPAGSVHSSPRLMLAPAGIRLPSGVRAIAAVNGRLATVIAEATGTRGYRPRRTPASVISEEETGMWGWGYAPALLTLALAPRRMEAGEGLLQGRGSDAARALGHGDGAVGGYFGLPDAAAKSQAKQVAEFVKLRARLLVMADKAQMKYSIMHSSPSNSALRIDHPVYDLAPKFVKNLAAIAEGLFVNIDFLCFTVQSPVTMQQMVANTSKGLLQVFEAVNDFHQVLNSAVENDVEMLNELRMYHKILQSEDYKASEYLVGPLERHLDIVTRKLYNLDKELRPTCLS